MGDQGVSVPVGDGSHLFENEPKPEVERKKIEAPLGIQEEDGSTTTMVREDTGKPAAIRSEVVDIKGPKQIIEEALSVVEPCCSCANFDWPKPNSTDDMERRAVIMGVKSRMPAQMAHIWPHGGPPEEFGICDDPYLVAETKEGETAIVKGAGKALVHYHRPKCPNYRARSGE